MQINERSLIEGLSYALDVAEKNYFSHSKHVAYTATMLAKELNMTKDEQKDLYFAGLLHDIGLGTSYEMLEHCIFGRDIILKLPLNEKIAEYVYYHHEHVNGTGPFKLVGDEIPFEAQIICLANAFDIRFSKIKALDYETMGVMLKWIDDNQKFYFPEIIEALKRIIDKEVILLDYFNHEFNNILIKKIDITGDILDYEGVKAYACAFSDIIDKRSPFTYRHSMGIADLVNKIVTKLGYDEEIQGKMHIAALLHDVGKLTISNDIIDKEGKLDPEERFEINKHTYYTRWILGQIEGFEDITEYASNHHEKLTGKGYPLQLEAQEIGELERIMTICDIFQALTEDRPYREPMPIEKVWGIIDSMVNQGELDKVLVEKIKVILADDYK